MAFKPAGQRRTEGRVEDRHRIPLARRHGTHVAGRSTCLKQAGGSKRAGRTGLTTRSLPIRVTDATFDAEVVRSDLPVVVDFYADWSVPCRITEPIIRDLSAKMAGRVKFTKVNVDEAAGVARSYGIHSIPTFLFLKAGQEKGREVGPIGPVEFRAILRKHFSTARPRPSGGRPATP
jgi:thioredoxin 1